MNTAPVRILRSLLLAGLALAHCLAVIAQDVGAPKPGPTTAWILTETIPATEAVQAAAAEGEFVYAISSTQVAKYARATGQRVAVSIGDARHLNSSFFHAEKLYCAHSNYPLLPEQSELKVLDVKTMELGTFHDFGNYGGSLTWAVFYEGHWWCNFAHYGANNARTFLAKFTEDWREVQRWTYPDNVIRQLGTYSLSGGIWHADHLLVTGHDDPIVFRLRVPEQGAELEYVDQQSVPFTGQGIAADPLTGGLIGISRAEKQIRVSVEQPAPVRLRVLTYNIHHAEGVDGRLDLERIAAVICSVQPDLVALQEVDFNTERTQKVDQPAELARLTNLSVVFGRNLDLQGGGYGNAVLSRFPIVNWQNHHLPRFDDGEQWGALEVDLQLPIPHGPLKLLATHLDHRRDDRERIASAQWINSRVANAGDHPLLLAGDLNAVPDNAVLTELQKSWLLGTSTAIPTIPVDQPTRQIDYVLVRPASRWKVIEARVLDEPVASDHRPLLIVLELQAPQVKR